MLSDKAWATAGATSVDDVVPITSITQPPTFGRLNRIDVAGDYTGLPAYNAATHQGKWVSFVAGVSGVSVDGVALAINNSVSSAANSANTDWMSY